MVLLLLFVFDLYDIDLLMSVAHLATIHRGMKLDEEFHSYAFPQITQLWNETKEIMFYKKTGNCNFAITPSNL